MITKNSMQLKAFIKKKAEENCVSARRGSLSVLPRHNEIVASIKSSPKMHDF